MTKESLKEIYKADGRKRSEIAIDLDISDQQLGHLLSGARNITPQMESHILRKLKDTIKHLGLDSE